MTNEEIDALKPGREMDALIADMVFEYECQVTSDMDCPVYISGIGNGTYWDIGGELVDYDDLPNYSTSIADAWRVFYHMEDMGYEVCIESSILRFPEYRVVFSKDTFMNDQCFTESKSLPESICKAALKEMSHE